MSAFILSRSVSSSMLSVPASWYTWGSSCAATVSLTGRPVLSWVCSTLRLLLSSDERVWITSVSTGRPVLSEELSSSWKELTVISWERDVFLASCRTSSCGQTSFPTIIRPMLYLWRMILKIEFNSVEFNCSIFFSLYRLILSKKIHHFLRKIVRGKILFWWPALEKSIYSAVLNNWEVWASRQLSERMQTIKTFASVSELTGAASVRSFKRCRKNAKQNGGFVKPPKSQTEWLVWTHGAFENWSWRVRSHKRTDSPQPCTQFFSSCARRSRLLDCSMFVLKISPFHPRCTALSWPAVVSTFVHIRLYTCTRFVYLSSTVIHVDKSIHSHSLCKEGFAFADWMNNALPQVASPRLSSKSAANTLRLSHFREETVSTRTLKISRMLWMRLESTTQQTWNGWLHHRWDVEPFSGFGKSVSLSERGIHQLLEKRAYSAFQVECALQTIFCEAQTEKWRMQNADIAVFLKLACTSNPRGWNFTRQVIDCLDSKGEELAMWRSKMRNTAFEEDSAWHIAKKLKINVEFAVHKLTEVDNWNTMISPRNRKRIVPQWISLLTRIRNCKTMPKYFFMILKLRAALECSQSMHEFRVAEDWSVHYTRNS